MNKNVCVGISAFALLLGACGTQSGGETQNSGTAATGFASGTTFKYTYEKDCDSGYCDPNHCAVRISEPTESEVEISGGFIYNMSQGPQSGQFAACEGFSPSQSETYVLKSTSGSKSCVRVSTSQAVNMAYCSSPF